MKNLMCKLIPKQYDKVAALIDENQQHMTASDHAILADMRHMMNEHKTKFLNSDKCR
ncbi:hypothetical protein [Acinetobacter sp. NCu2D-2]|uniref:hypothetical protein n=1 Tax=Acinetobacter sp. NCu2D-2 TaxID=1608473 RepID=UPI000A401A43|nr:hypothetical protein [Acinetobacter sp. NCu2D-2]